MEWLNLTLSFLSLAAVVIGGLFLGSYLPSYMTEKGKNLASKEDLAGLTRLVEGVKAEHAAQMERLRADLLSESEVLERRRRVYEEICASLRIFIVGHGASEEAQDRFYEAYAAAWLWASDAVLVALNRFIQLQAQVVASPGSIEQPELKGAYTTVIFAMRKDVGFALTATSSTDYQFVHF